MNVIKDAVIRMKEIQSFAQQFTDEALSLDGSSMERVSPGRVELGMAIRRWGPHWRSSVIYALLTQLTEAGKGSSQYSTPSRCDMMAN